ncbi:MAG TPA: hypothetical protein VNP92_04650 [Actinophytocola sp.]|nr:hypothetical protein [Actinophytocola sp.]
MLVYTAAGFVSAVAVGAALGAVGALLLPPLLLVVLAVAVVALAREAGLVRFPLPQPLRQTKDIWAKRYGGHTTAMLWGLDLGTVVSTRFTFAGTWVLILLPLLTGDPLLGVLAFASCWLGRVATVWIGPLFVPPGGSVVDLMDAIDTQHRPLRLTQVLGIALLIGYIVWTAW